LLEHIRHALCLPRRLMHGLYTPHGPLGEARYGPATPVLPSPFMIIQLKQWLYHLSGSAGSAFTSVLRRSALPSLDTIIYSATSDAATDSVPPGMGGFMHGFYWYLALSDEIIKWIHISVLELLATGFSAVVFHPLLPSSVRLSLGADALATPYTLVRETEKSAMLTAAHHALLNNDTFVLASKQADLGHLRGDANLVGDTISRGKWILFARLCRDLRIRPNQLHLPPSCLRILSSVLQTARDRGIPLRPNFYQPASALIPPHDYALYLVPPLHLQVPFNPAVGSKRTLSYLSQPSPS
jgi:hypothetical protein